MTFSSVKIPYAEKNDRLVHVSRVARGLGCGCVCPACKQPVLARKGHVMTHHFAHHRQGKCSPETALHLIGKRLLYARLGRHIARGRPLALRWDCRFCPDVHEGNLLRLARETAMEKDLGGCRPDIVLLSEGGQRVLAAIEIVVTHRPDEHVLEYCRRHGVTLVCFHVRSGRDLLALEIETPLRPSYVGRCPNPGCDVCGQALSRATMHVVNIPCWRCGFVMKAALMKANGRMAGPEAFSAAQTRMAEDSGVYISRHFSHTAGRRYMANTCPTCGAFAGASYLRLHSGRARTGSGRAAGEVCMHCRTTPAEGT